MADGRRTTMPAKMISEMPLPMPFSEICSPSHMISAVPAVRVTMVSSRKPQPGSGEYDALTKIGRMQAESFGRFLAMLDGVVEADGKTMLDNSIVLWTSEHKAKDGGHDRRDVPFLIAGSAGGAFKTGRLLRFDGRAHNDLYVAIAQALGYTDINTFGDPEVCKGALPL